MHVQKNSVKMKKLDFLNIEFKSHRLLEQITIGNGD